LAALRRLSFRLRDDAHHVFTLAPRARFRMLELDDLRPPLGFVGGYPFLVALSVPKDTPNIN
jgi:hypothetical protein